MQKTFLVFQVLESAGTVTEAVLRRKREQKSAGCGRPVQQSYANYRDLLRFRLVRVNCLWHREFRTALLSYLACRDTPVSRMMAGEGSRASSREIPGDHAELAALR